MYQRVNEHDFIDAFRQFDRLDTGDGTGGNFTPAGCRALFDYLEELEDSMGEPIELDVVALCCDFAEYDNIAEAAEEYSGEPALVEALHTIDMKSVTDASDEIDEAFATLFDWFRDNTAVIEIPDSDRVIISAF